MHNRESVSACPRVDVNGRRESAEQGDCQGQRVGDGEELC